MTSNKFYRDMYDRPVSMNNVRPDLFGTTGLVDGVSGLQGCFHNMLGLNQRVKPISGFEITNAGTTYTIHSGWALVENVLTNIAEVSEDISTDPYAIFSIDRVGADILHDTAILPLIWQYTGYMLGYVTPMQANATKMFPEYLPNNGSKMLGGIKASNALVVMDKMLYYGLASDNYIYFTSGIENYDQSLKWGNNQLGLISPTVVLSGSVEVTGSIYLTGGIQKNIGNTTITGNVYLTGQLSMPNSPIISPLYITTPTNDLGLIIQNKTTSENHRTIYVTSDAEWISLFPGNTYNGYDGDVLIICGTWTHSATNTITLAKSISIYGNSRCNLGDMFQNASYCVFEGVAFNRITSIGDYNAYVNLTLTELQINDTSSYITISNCSIANYLACSGDFITISNCKIACLIETTSTCSNLIISNCNTISISITSVTNCSIVNNTINGGITIDSSNYIAIDGNIITVAGDVGISVTSSGYISIINNMNIITSTDMYYTSGSSNIVIANNNPTIA